MVKEFLGSLFIDGIELATLMALADWLEENGSVYGTKMQRALAGKKQMASFFFSTDTSVKGQYIHLMEKQLNLKRLHYYLSIANKRPMIRVVRTVYCLQTVYFHRDLVAYDKWEDVDTEPTKATDFPNKQPFRNGLLMNYESVELRVIATLLVEMCKLYTGR